MSFSELLAFLLLPFLIFLIDGVASARARSRQYNFETKTESDFTVLVPIYGNIKYLENVEFLSRYGSRVILCTTGNETETFMSALRTIATQHGFWIFRATWGAAQDPGKRATSGTIRDRLIRDVLRSGMIKTAYTIPLDADSTARESLEIAVGELVRRGGDIASVRLVPRDSNSLLTKLQQFEYRLSMNFRFVMPWLVSGACQIARTEVLRDIMDRHSMFFQGNDVEIGLIAKRRGYQVVHIPFQIYTTVPDTLNAWFRQRLAWSGGEFRLFIMNIQFMVKQPVFWFYGTVVTIAMFPLRWIAITTVSWALVTALGLYLLLVLVLHRKAKSGWVLLMPFYALFSSIILTPLGVPWYFWMAYKDRNMGIIKPNRAVEAQPATP